MKSRKLFRQKKKKKILVINNDEKGALEKGTRQLAGTFVKWDAVLRWLSLAGVLFKRKFTNLRIII